MLPRKNVTHDITDLHVFNIIKKLDQQGIQIYLEKNKLKYRTLVTYFNEDSLKDIRKQKERIIRYLLEFDDKIVSLSPLQLAYMTGQAEGQILNGVNAHYYVEYDKDNIEIEKLEKIINLLIIKNDVLRLVLLQNGNGLILDSVPNYVVKSYMYENENDRNIMREELSHKKYNIETWPMFNFIVGKNIKGHDVIHISFDCSILDAWSASSMLDKLFRLYSDEKVEFSEYTYKSYMKDLKKYKDKDINKEILKNADLYWDEKTNFIAKFPKLKMKTKIENIKTTTFVRQEYIFDSYVTTALEKMAKEQKITVSSSMITVYMKVLSYFSGGGDITINATLFGKLPVDRRVENLLGEFTNTGLLQYNGEEKSFLKSIKETQKQIFKLLEFRIYDGVNIIRKVSNKNMDNDIFPVVVTCMIGEEYKSEQNGFLETYSLSQTPQVAIDHHIRVIDGKIKISFDYVEELFDKDYIKLIINEYIKIIENVSKSYQ